MKRRLFVATGAALFTALIGGCTMTSLKPVAEAAAKRDSMALLNELRTAWEPLGARWSAPDTLIYRTGSEPCQIVTSAGVGGGWADGPEAARLLPSFNQVVQAHGYPTVKSVQFSNGQAVIRTTHTDGRVVELRGRSGDLEVYVPAPASQCEVAPRRI